MKKSRESREKEKRLQLHRETLRKLVAGDLVQDGGYNTTNGTCTLRPTGVAEAAICFEE